MRLTAGTTILRGDLRLEQRGSALTGSLALESSDGPPVTFRGGRVGSGGTVEFTVDGAEPMSFTGRRDGGGLAGQVEVGRARPTTWTAERLPDGAEFYAALPRFRAAQLTIGRNVTEIRLPGAWVEAADREAGTAGRASALAVAAGLTPVPPEMIRTYGFLPSLGLFRRDELVPVLAQALGAIRAELPTAERAQFDAFFRPRGDWIVDLHAAALDRARRRFRNLSWDGAEPALAAAGLLPGNLPAGTSVVPLALYRLAVLRERDSTAFAAAKDRLSLGGAASAQMAVALLDGYRDAAVWQGQAVEFLLAAAWVTTAGRRSSPAGLVRTAWNQPDLPIPAIRPRYFGIPEAIPRVGMPAAAVERVVTAENWAGAQWMANRGTGAMLDVVRQLPLGIGVSTTLEDGGQWLLTSVAREAAATPAGFLESVDEIIEDPGTPPVYAVATALHEWQHLLMERHRLLLPAGGALRDDGNGLRLAASDLFLAEGFAEWATERLLAPMLTQLPVLGVGDAQKLAVLEAENPADPHVLGLRMLQALAAALGSADSATALVLAHADSPAEVAAAVPAWRGAGAPDRVLPARGQRRLVPEVIFSIEDGVGDLLSARIRVAPDTSATR